MGINSIKQATKNDQKTLNAVFTYQNMVKYRLNQKILQNYQFLQQIGSGSEGSVFKAKCKRSGLIRAIKKINKLNKLQTCQYLQNQYGILKMIDHPNIVKLYQMYQQDSYIYMVTQLCLGKQLFELILQEKVIGQQICFPIFYQILLTVNFLHHNNIMHRDIKPQNIMVNEQQKTIKLIDLGTALRFVDSKIINRKRIGTSYYIAPEVLRRQYNQKCDVWSLGVLLYIMLTGTLPFKGNNDEDVLKQVQNKQLQFLHPKWRTVSNNAKELVQKLLQRQISKRLSAKEILQSAWVKQNVERLNKNNLDLNQKTIAHLWNMKRFKQQKCNPLQQGLFIFIVNFVQKKDGEKQFLQTFKALDTNEDGVISICQLKLGLQKYLKLNKRQCEIIANKIFQNVDINNSGSIDYTQFVMSASNVQIVVTQENIDLAFKYIDNDGSGKLSIQELRQKLGTSITQPQYNNLLKQFDKNSDGEISKYQFRDMMKALVKTSNGNCKPVINNNPNKNMPNKQSACKVIQKTSLKPRFNSLRGKSTSIKSNKGK